MPIWLDTESGIGASRTWYENWLESEVRKQLFRDAPAGRQRPSVPTEDYTTSSEVRAWPGCSFRAILAELKDRSNFANPDAATPDDRPGAGSET